MQNKISDKLPILVWKRQQRNKSLAVALMIVALTGCAADGGTVRDGRDTADDARSVEASNAPSAENLDPDLLFHALAAERLGSQGNYLEAYGHAYEASLLSEDADLARQAVSLAMRVGYWEGVTQAARRWLQLDPASTAASQLVVLGLINQDQAEAAARELAVMIESADDVAEAWRETTLLMASAELDEQALATMDALAERLPDEDPGRILESRSLLLWQLGQPEAAFDLARRAAEDSNDIDRLVWTAQLAVANEDYEAALEWYRQARRIDAGDAGLALAEAEVLRQMERGDEALELLASVPPSTSTLYTLGIYQFELDDLAAARQSWDRLAALDSPDDPLEHAYLTGFLAELLELDEEALGWYEQVEEGENANRALLRRAGIEGRNGSLMEARNLLRAVRLGADEDLAEQAWLTEAELLREAGRADECIEMLTEVLREQPSSIWLLYSRSLCAVDADMIELAEQDLRRIIQIDGENAMALNALGYTLTDRTRRHSEALRLIERALELQPEDPATLDSMGWVLYRLGRLEESVVYLERAWAMDKNPEIGAHLAEVLFFLDRRDEAMVLMEALLNDHPDDAIVIETRDRLMQSQQ
jgi:tetratricopeptide (TPR) repeat protein